MASDTFKINWDFGEDIKNNELEDIIYENIKKIRSMLKQPKIKQSNQKEDMENGIDYHLNWNIPLAFRGRRCAYTTYASKQKGGSFTLRETGENGGKAEIHKMIEGNYKSLIYVFVWSCGSYAILDIKKWIKSGILQKKLNGFKLKNKNPYNKFVAFTLSELNKCNCVIYFYNAKNTRLDQWLR